jgi:ABC-type transport system involved in cytochrome c biogenesis permease subunit
MLVFPNIKIIFFMSFFFFLRVPELLCKNGFYIWSLYMPFLFLIFILLFGPLEATLSLGEVPVAYKGRFRPMEAYSYLWLYHLSNKSAITGIDSPNQTLFLMQFQGHNQFDDIPLFSVNQSQLKSLLNFHLQKNLYSYNELQQAIEQNRETNLRLMHILLPYHYHKAFHDPSNRSRSEKLEITSLSPGLWVTKKGDQLVILASPKNPPWIFLEAGMVFEDNIDPSARRVAEEFMNLIGKMREYTSSNQLQFLPSKRSGGEWLPLSALKKEINPTRYSDERFKKIKSIYLNLEKALKESKAVEVDNLTETLSQELIDGYASIAGSVYQEMSEKKLSYPTVNQIWAEYIYYHYPLTMITIISYGLVLLLFLLTRKYLLLGLIPFAMHTLILALRCYILGRPPVSNMFETVVYVPWVAVLTGYVLYFFTRNKVLVIASTAAAFLFLIFLQLTHLDNGMENVQAVLDSQFWLMIHVLMVVGSYGLFILAGILGHLYLGMHLYYHSETPAMANLGRNIIQIIFIGTSLLITGTILGGVWAAESWGRFWDWDPKESWAFISSCIYLIWIHLYTFGHIGNFGLAVGSVAGLSAIGFTWYGVNYILGTGLHSYGFGTGGEQYFYLFMLLEALFLGWVWARARKRVGAR